MTSTRLTIPARQAVAPLSAARALAVAHYVDRLIQKGTMRRPSEAARRLGIHQRHLTFISRLRWLAPDIQAAIMTREIDVAEHRLRDVARHAAWRDQRRALKCATQLFEMRNEEKEPGSAIQRDPIQEKRA